jgi:hypothetical protein
MPWVTGHSQAFRVFNSFAEAETWRLSPIYIGSTFIPAKGWHYGPTVYWSAACIKKHGTFVLTLQNCACYHTGK